MYDVTTHERTKAYRVFRTALPTIFIVILYYTTN